MTLRRRCPIEDEDCILCRCSVFNICCVCDCAIMLMELAGVMHFGRMDGVPFQTPKPVPEIARYFKTGPKRCEADKHPKLLLQL